MLSASLSVPNSDRTSTLSSTTISPAATPTRPYIIPVVVEESHSEIVATIQPDAESKVSSIDGSANVVFPASSRSQTFQAGIASNSKHCHYEPALSAAILSCVRIDIFDRFGNVEQDVTLDSPAIVNMVINPIDEELEELSGLGEAYESGGVRFLFREYQDQEWSETPFSLNISSDDSVAIAATSDRLGIFALVADLESQAPVPSAEATATPTIAPLPTPTPTPTPAAEITTESVSQGASAGAAVGTLLAMLSPYLILLWYARMLGFPL